MQEETPLQKKKTIDINVLPQRHGKYPEFL